MCPYAGVRERAVVDVGGGECGGGSMGMGERAVVVVGGDRGWGGGVGNVFCARMRAWARVRSWAWERGRDCECGCGRERGGVGRNGACVALGVGVINVVKWACSALLVCAPDVKRSVSVCVVVNLA